MKRIFDVLCSLIALIPLSPLFLIISILIKIESKGPIFFRQERVGKNGKTFRLYKFRSMVVNADKTGPYFTTINDNRITKVGKFIRATSLDELPQIINVLVGEMSLVGPRPDVPAQKELYKEEEWIERHKVKPGITGLAQATLRSSATMDKRTELDIQYVRSCNLLMDLKIIWWTIKQLIVSRSY